ILEPSCTTSSRRSTPKLIPNLEEKKTERAQGVFLWVQLVVKQILDLGLEVNKLVKIEAEFNSIPEKLGDVYKVLIRKMEADSLKLSQCICFATRPLYTGELCR
ncbi:hypothetical protein BN1708_015912, partial [Verticillium longisporum]